MRIVGQAHMFAGRALAVLAVNRDDKRAFQNSKRGRSRQHEGVLAIGHRCPEFSPRGALRLLHGAPGAFRTLLKFEPTPADCLQYFGEREQAFRMAADRKIAQQNIAVGKNLHLTSRDVARKLAGPAFVNHGEIE